MLNIRLEDEHYAKIESDAAEDGHSLSNYVRLKLGLPPSRYSSKRSVLLGEPVVLLADPVALEAKRLDAVGVTSPGLGKTDFRKSPRTEMCVHRVQTTSYCSRCD